MDIMMTFFRTILNITLILTFTMPNHAFADLSKGKEHFYKQEFTASIKEIRSLAISGNAEAELFLGLCYLSMDEPLKGFNWVRSSAKKGFHEAQFTLGSIYGVGVGTIKKDTIKAHEWYLKAANTGSAYAMYELGQDYYFGGAVEINRQEAAKWFKRAIRKGFSETIEFRSKFDPSVRMVEGRAMYFLGSIYERPDHLRLINEGGDPVLATSWYLRGAEKGDVTSMLEISKAYRYGVGIKKNIHKARAWCEKFAAGYALFADEANQPIDCK